MIDESNNYQLGLDFFYRQNSDIFSISFSLERWLAPDSSKMVNILLERWLAPLTARFFISFSLERWLTPLTAQKW